MKHLSILFIFTLILTSCEKQLDNLTHCGPSECTICTAEESDFNLIPEGTVEEIVEPLVFDEACDCIVSGKVKYINDGNTIAILDYGKGECDQWVVKTTCPGGKCKSKDAECCKFMQDCGGNQYD